MHAKEDMAVELARGPDADAKCSVYILSDMGKKRYDWEVVNQYGKLLQEYFNNRAGLQLLGSLFDAPQGQVTYSSPTFPIFEMSSLQNYLTNDTSLLLLLLPCSGELGYKANLSAYERQAAGGDGSKTGTRGGSG